MLIKCLKILDFIRLHRFNRKNTSWYNMCYKMSSFVFSHCIAPWKTSQECKTSLFWSWNSRASGMEHDISTIGDILVNLSNCLNFATGKSTGKQQKEFLRLYVHLKSYYSTVTVASIVLILEAPQSRLFGVQCSAHVLPKIYITLYVSQSKFVWPMHIFAPFIYQLLGVP